MKLRLKIMLLTTVLLVSVAPQIKAGDPICAPNGDCTETCITVTGPEGVPMEICNPY